MEGMYRERVFSGLLAVIPGSVALVLLSLFVYARLSGIFEEPSTPWFFLGTGVFLVLTTINFLYLVVTISRAGVSTRFGVLSHNVPVNDVKGIYKDNASSLSYGGYGVRFGRVNGKLRVVYNVAGAPRVVVQLSRENDREFVFSTKKPDEAMKAIVEVAGIRGKAGG